MEFWPSTVQIGFCPPIVRHCSWANFIEFYSILGFLDFWKIFFGKRNSPFAIRLKTLLFIKCCESSLVTIGWGKNFFFLSIFFPKSKTKVFEQIFFKKSKKGRVLSREPKIHLFLRVWGFLEKVRTNIFSPKTVSPFLRASYRVLNLDSWTIFLLFPFHN